MRVYGFARLWEQMIIRFRRKSFGAKCARSTAQQRGGEKEFNLGWIYGRSRLGLALTDPSEERMSADAVNSRHVVILGGRAPRTK